MLRQVKQKRPPPLSDCRDCFPSAITDRRLGESAQEIAAVGGPDEALGHDRITLVVDLEASAVHEPRPGALDDPAFGERLEAPGWMRFTTSTPT